MSEIHKVHIRYITNIYRSVIRFITIRQNNMNRLCKQVLFII